MKMKCIGGACHGKTTEVDNYYGIGDQIRMPSVIEFRISVFEEDLKSFREGRSPDSLSVPYHYYKIEIIHFSKEEFIKFLIPVDWTPKQALSVLLLPCS